MKKFYVTTAIDYANGKPHIGHAYGKILADTLARIHRTQGENVQFMTGLDEHGQKVEQAAHKNNITPLEWCDQEADEFKNLCSRLDISYNRYIRTTETEHKKVVQECLQKLYDKGDIYQASYTGFYSKSAERFVQEKDMIDGKWPFEYGEVVEISETNYFFKLKNHQQWLLEYVQSHPDFIWPTYRAKQVIEFLKEPINDLCISRPKSRLSWGIELPFDSEYVTYVWFDALLNYITGAGFGTPQFSSLWPADFQVIGKDILVPAHAIYWPIILHALSIELPKTLLVHGWWLMSGEKMSKSAGNVIDPLQLVDKYGADAFRFYLLREMSNGQDCEFSTERFLIRYNADLANSLGNLVSRLLNMGHRYCGGTFSEPPVLGEREKNLQMLWTREIPTILSSYHHGQIHTALEKIIDLVTEVNGYIETCAPWKLAKLGTEEAMQQVRSCLFVASECVFIGASLLSPVMPTIAKKIRTLFGDDGDFQWPADLAFSHQLLGRSMGEKCILFPKLED